MLELFQGDDSSTRETLRQRFVMLKASQLFPDGRNHSIPMILVSNDQPHVPALPINIWQRGPAVSLGRAPVNLRSVLRVSCPIRVCAQSPTSNGFYCAQEAETSWPKHLSQDLPVQLLEEFTLDDLLLKASGDIGTKNRFSVCSILTIGRSSEFREGWRFAISCAVNDRLGNEGVMICSWWNRLTACFTFKWFSQWSCRNGLNSSGKKWSVFYDKLKEKYSKKHKWGLENPPKRFCRFLRGSKCVQSLKRKDKKFDRTFWRFCILLIRRTISYRTILKILYSKKRFREKVRNLEGSVQNDYGSVLNN